MGKGNIIQTDFGGGEIAPELYGRVNIPRYANGAKLLENVYVRVTGPSTRRPGTRFVQNAGEGITVRLIPFVVWRTDTTPPKLQGYQCEFRSDGKIRFYTECELILSGGSPYEISSPYTTSLDKIKYEPNNNELYFVHPDVPPKKLTRTSDTSWAIADVSFTQPTPPHWDATSGYPTAIAFFEQRMVLGGTKAEPYTLWFSQSGDILNLVVGTGASDPMEIKPTAATSNIIHIVATKLVCVFTYDKELTIQGSSSESLNPSNIQIKSRAPYGCNLARPQIVGEDVIYCTRHGKNLRSLGYNFESDAYKSTDLALASNHLAELGIVQLAFSPAPIPIIWAVTTGGNLLMITYDKDQSVTAWAQSYTVDGVIKDISIIPYNNTDQVWIAVERTIDGHTYTYIEFFDGSLNTDSAYVGTSTPGQSVWTVAHLNGKTVDIIADGTAMPTQVVTSNQITLPRDAHEVEIGLHYTSTIQTLPPEIPTAVGTSQGQDRSVHKIFVRLLASTGCYINGKEISFRKFGTGVLDHPIESFTGDKSMSNLGWDDGSVTIEQRLPHAFTCLGVIKKITVND